MREPGSDGKLNVMFKNFQIISKLLNGIYRTDVTWRDQNLGRKVEVIYMDEPCNACFKSHLQPHFTSTKMLVLCRVQNVQCMSNCT